jgi:LmbE family N-acetylglucosaminyl deacetylase
MKNLLFIGAHPDDVELGCLGTIHKHLQNGDKVYVIVATDGEAGNIDVKKFNRFEESIKCLEEVGVPPQNIIGLHLPDTGVITHRQSLLAQIEEFCKNHKIDTIYVNSNKDYHQDHVVVFEETIRGARKVPNILVYESNSSTLPTFAPNFFVDITNFVDKKAEFLKYHESQNQKYFIKDSSVKSLAKFRGNQTKMFVEYAEAFEVFRMVHN